LPIRLATPPIRDNAALRRAEPLSLNQLPDATFFLMWNPAVIPMLRLILLIILILAVLGSVPLWPYSMGWGYGPSGGLGLVLIVLLILILAGRL
jgi:hypothetical protein